MARSPKRKKPGTTAKRKPAKRTTSTSRSKTSRAKTTARSPQRTRRKAPSQPQVFTCGTPQVVVGLESRAATGGGWPRLNLTFSIGPPPPQIAVQVFQNAVRSALQIWRQAVPFTFTEVPSGGTLSIAGVAAQHHDGFDFPPGTIELAHAFGPATGGGTLDGQVHLNNAKRWANGTGADGDVLTIVLHELGHALGIVAHFGDASTVMNGSFPAGLVRQVLTPADKAAMLNLYQHLIT